MEANSKEERLELVWVCGGVAQEGSCLAQTLQVGKCALRLRREVHRTHQVPLQTSARLTTNRIVHVRFSRRVVGGARPTVRLVVAEVAGNTCT